MGGTQVQGHLETPAGVSGAVVEFMALDSKEEEGIHQPESTLREWVSHLTTQ